MVPFLISQLGKARTCINYLKAGVHSLCGTSVIEESLLFSKFSWDLMPCRAMSENNNSNNETYREVEE